MFKMNFSALFVAIFCLILANGDEFASPTTGITSSTDDIENLNPGNSWILPNGNYSVFYRHFRDRISWIEADAVCQFHHGQLANVAEKVAFEAVNNYLKDLDVTDLVWIGLKRTAPSDVFFWNNKEALTKTEHWQESPQKSDTSLCAITDPMADFKWKALECNGPASATFVCELEVPEWAQKNGLCKITTREPLAILYLPNQSAIEISNDCGSLEGIKKVRCNGQSNRQKVISALSCLSDKTLGGVGESVSEGNDTIALGENSNKTELSNGTIEEKGNYDQNVDNGYISEITTTSVDSEESNETPFSTAILPEQMSLAEEPIKSSIQIPINDSKEQDIVYQTTIDPLFNVSSAYGPGSFSNDTFDASDNITEIRFINDTKNFDAFDEKPRTVTLPTLIIFGSNFSVRVSANRKVQMELKNKMIEHVSKSSDIPKYESTSSMEGNTESNPKKIISGFDKFSNETDDEKYYSEISNMVKKSVNSESGTQNAKGTETYVKGIKGNATKPYDNLEETLMTPQLKKMQPINVYKKIEIKPLDGGNLDPTSFEPASEVGMQKNVGTESKKNTSSTEETIIPMAQTKITQSTPITPDPKVVPGMKLGITESNPIFPETKQLKTTESNPGTKPKMTESGGIIAGTTAESSPVISPTKQMTPGTKPKMTESGGIIPGTTAESRGGIIPGTTAESNPVISPTKQMTPGTKPKLTELSGIIPGSTPNTSESSPVISTTKQMIPDPRTKPKTTESSTAIKPKVTDPIGQNVLPLANEESNNKTTTPLAAFTEMLSSGMEITSENAIDHVNPNSPILSKNVEPNEPKFGRKRHVTINRSHYFPYPHFLRRIWG